MLSGSLDWSIVEAGVGLEGRTLVKWISLVEVAGFEDLLGRLLCSACQLLSIAVRNSVVDLAANCGHETRLESWLISEHF